MTFVEIASRQEAEDFLTWLKAQKKFPLDIYLNGVTLTFDTTYDALYFAMGMETVLDMGYLP